MNGKSILMVMLVVALAGFAFVGCKGKGGEAGKAGGGNAVDQLCTQVGTAAEDVLKSEGKQGDDLKKLVDANIKQCKDGYSTAGEDGTKAAKGLVDKCKDKKGPEFLTCANVSISK